MKNGFSALAIAASTAIIIGCGGSAPIVVAHNDPPPPPPRTCVEEWVHMPVLIGFPTGGTILDVENRLILREVVRTAQSRDDIRRVMVEGHTDTCGNERDNMALSVQRAVSVANELVSMGVPREMLETVGRGSTIPRGEESCNRETTLTQATNRRVEFNILACRTDT